MITVKIARALFYYPKNIICVIHNLLFCSNTVTKILETCE